MIDFPLNVFGFGFALAQGGAIFLTAWLAKRYLNLGSAWWKPLLMLMSYFAWIVATGVGYTLLGGEWGMMDGGLFMLSLFGTAAKSAMLYAVVWQVAPLFLRHENG